jgi:hypothetical protein
MSDLIKTMDEAVEIIGTLANVDDEEGKYIIIGAGKVTGAKIAAATIDGIGVGSTWDGMPMPLDLAYEMFIWLRDRAQAEISALGVKD